jgi:DNA-dependent protein kinase catalytic subunit
MDGSAVGEKPWMTYLPLWRVMLAPLHLKDVDFPDDFRNEVSGVVYDELMRAIMALLSSLNLTFVEAPSAKTAEDADDLRSGENMVTQFPADHEILQNLVNFCEDLLQSSHQNLFCRRWVFLFGEQIIHASADFPLVAGFYRLMAVVFRICESQRYFEGLETDATSLLANVAAAVRAQAAASNELVSASAVARGVATTRDVTFVLFGKFVREIVSRSQQFKDELLAAAISLLLAVPREFLNVSLTMPSFEMAFRMGLVFEPLARMGLDALEHWMHVAPNKVLPHLNVVLPLLGDYLASESKTATVDGSRPDEQSHVKLKFKKKPGSKMEKVAISRKSLSVDIQHRILGLLGMMGGHNEAILSSTSLDNDQSTAWDPVKRIRFKIPMTDLIPVMYFDELLPRIVFLAESSPDRRTKVASCELLHTLVLYMIGMNSSDPSKDKAGDKTTGTNFAKIYDHIFPAVLRLATDLDVVAKQLFYTLTFQCICWFTGNKMPESPETMSLLNAIVAAVGDEHSSALRAFGARCVGEFYRCSQKRGVTEGGAANNFKSLLRRVFSLAHQPSPYARLGAVMAFAQIYREFRGSATLVKEHLLDMLYEMLQSLRASHQDAEAVGTAGKAAFVIRQLSRIALKVSTFFLKKKNYSLFLFLLL